MRISFILSSLRLSGGVRDIVEYANRLTARGHQIALIIPGGASDADMERETHPSVKIIESNVPFREDATALYQLRLSWSMARAVPPSDIVISTHTPTTVPGFLSTRVLHRGVPVWFFQDYLDMFRGRRVEQWLLRNAARWHVLTLTISNYAADELRAYAPGRIEVAHIGLSHAEAFRPAPIGERVSTLEWRILTLTDMRPRKGLYDFLDAATIVQKHLPNIRLWIVSKEPCEIQSDVPFDYIYRPSRSQLADLYATCDLFVLASRSESLGIPPLEAMASATPVVLADSGGVRDYAISGENCLLTPVQQPQALAEAILNVLNDRPLAERLSANGPPTAAQYDWEVVTDAFEQKLFALIRSH